MYKKKYKDNHIICLNVIRVTYINYNTIMISILLRIVQLLYNSIVFPNDGIYFYISQIFYC